MASKKKNKQQQAMSSGFVPATADSAKKGISQMPVAASAGPAGQYSRSNPNYQSHGRGTSRGKIAIIVIIVAAVIAALVGGGLYLYKESQKSAINQDLHSMDEAQMKAVDAELTGTSSFEEPFNVLLLGSDARADDPDMGARTDTIIVVRVDPVENVVSMVSIPRDTMIEIDGVGTQKFNAAYTYGGESGTIAAVKKLTGVSIDHFAEVNFESMVGLVDAIGGIDVVVDEEIDDEDAGGHIDKGKQHLNGEQALIFARSRKFADGDYTRQVNQRKVILAIVNKALTAPATELTGLIKSSTKFVTTDSGIDFDFIYSLADQMRHNDKDITIHSATIPSQAAMIGDVSYVVADTAGVKAMMKLFQKGKDVSGEIKESSISEDIAEAQRKNPPSTTSTIDQSQENGGMGEMQENEDYDPSLYEEDYSYDEVDNTGGDSGADDGDGGDASDASADGGDAGGIEVDVE